MKRLHSRKIKRNVLTRLLLKLKRVFGGGGFSQNKKRAY